MRMTVLLLISLWTFWLLYYMFAESGCIPLLGLHLKGLFVNQIALSLNYPTISSLTFCFMSFLIISCTDLLDNALFKFIRFSLFLGVINMLGINFPVMVPVYVQHQVNLLLNNGLNEIHPILLYLSVSVFTLIIFISAVTSIWSIYWSNEFLSYSRFISPTLIFYSTFCALLLGAWWAFQEAGWSGWWAWEISEVLLLFLFTSILLLLHCRFSLKHYTRLNYYFLQLILILYILKYVIITQTVGTLHTFFTSSGASLDNFVLVNSTLTCISVVLLLVPYLRSADFWEYNHLHRPYRRLWLLLFWILPIVWFFILSYYNVAVFLKKTLLISVLVLFLSGFNYLSRLRLLMKNRYHLGGALFLISQLCGGREFVSFNSMLVFNVQTNHLALFGKKEIAHTVMDWSWNTLNSNNLSSNIFKLNHTTLTSGQVEVIYAQATTLLRTLVDEEMFFINFITLCF